MKKAKRLREMLKKGMVVAPFCLNAYHAKIAHLVGFKAIYMTGWGTAAERGFPDVGLITLTEMAENARYISNAVDLPVICDADTGYGNPINVWRTVNEYENAGAAAIHLEDQVFPKKCGFFAGKQIIPKEDQIQKIRAALDARRDKDFMVIARCDALAVNGWEDTILRCRAYYEAGADLIFVDGIQTIDDLEIYARELREIPKVYHGTLLPTYEIAKKGFNLMLTGGTNRVIFKAVKEAFEELKKKGVVSPKKGAISGKEWDKALEMMGLSNIYEMERKYHIKDLEL